MWRSIVDASTVATDTRRSVTDDARGVVVRHVRAALGVATADVSRKRRRVVAFHLPVQFEHLRP